MSPERLHQFLKDVRELTELVRFDEHGRLVAGQYVGGNGGLISRDTMAKNDAVVRDLDVIQAMYK